jgi:CheY-like chemotaxis protein
MTILGNTELALMGLVPDSSLRGHIMEIEKAGRSASALANQMLAYSGKGRFVLESIDLNQLVDGMSHLLKVAVSGRAVLKRESASHLPAFEGDATQIRQVIVNLVTNASEAIGDRGGKIVISTGTMDCDRAFLDQVDEVLGASVQEPLPEGVYVYLRVRDTGCGMDAGTREKLFDPFFTTKFTGRGLGMAAVLGIVRGHGGAIEIQSKQGAGTSFRILFPASEAHSAPSGVAGVQEALAEKWRGEGPVLIVDDEAAVCRVAKALVELLGFRVVTAGDGREALDVFRKHADEIVCVLLDLIMPHLDGEQTYRELRGVDPDVKVVLCSGYNEDKVTERFSGMGLAGFLQKPYGLTDLSAKLRQVLAT